MNKMLKVHEVADRLGLHRNTVRRLSDRGELLSFRVCKRGDRRWREEDVDRYLAQLNQPGGS